LELTKNKRIHQTWEEEANAQGLPTTICLHSMFFNAHNNSNNNNNNKHFEGKRKMM
jgi:hypothetical protein